MRQFVLIIWDSANRNAIAQIVGPFATASEAWAECEPGMTASVWPCVKPEN